MTVFTYAEFGMNCLKNERKYYKLFRVLRWEFASVYILNNVCEYKRQMQTNVIFEENMYAKICNSL